MSSWSLLPQEIIEQIFSHLGSRHRDLIECQLTCRNWSTAAQAQLYTDVDLYELNQLSESNLMSFFHTVANSPSSPGNFLKSIGLDSEVIDKLLALEDIYPSPANGAYYTNFGILFPYLEKFCASKGGSSNLIWVKVLHERYSNHWPRLKEIPEIDFIKNQAYYSCAALACRENLESLSLHHTTHPTYENEVQVHYNILVQGLQHFTSLKILEIMADQSHIKSLHQFDSVIEKCSELKSLLFGCEAVTHGSSSTATPTLRDLSLVNPRPNIKKFEGWSNYLDDLSTSYLMKKLPNVDTIVLAGIWKKLNLSESRLLTFYGYLRKVPKYVLHDEVRRSSSAKLDLINSFIQGAKSTQQDIMLKTTYSHRSSKVNVAICSSKYSEVDKFYGEKRWWYTVDKMNDYVFFGKLTPAGGTTTTLDCIDSSNSNSNDNILENLYLQHIIKQHRKNFSQIFFGTSNNSKSHRELQYSKGRSYEATYEGVGHCLHNIFKHCTSLKKLVLHHVILYEFPTAPRINESLTTLEIKYCDMRQDVLTKLSFRLPALKNLTLSSCSYFDTDTEDYVLDYDDPVRKINMPYTSFDTLRWKDSDCFVDDILQKDGFYLQVCSDAGKSLYWYNADDYTLQQPEDDLDGDDITDDKHLFFSVSCKSLKTFIMQSRDSYKKICYIDI